jgi:peptidyl-prolyl cis-trans isomerase C
METNRPLHNLHVFIATAACIAVLGIGACTSTPEPPPPEKVVAWVGQNPIMIDDFNRNVAARMQQLQGRNPSLNIRQEHVQRAQETALLLLIQRELLYQEAMRRGISVTVGERGSRVRALRERLGSEKDYRRMLEQSGKSEEDFLIEVVDKDLLVQKLMDAEVTAKINVSDQDIQDRYEAEKLLPMQLHARHIVKLMKENAPQEEQQRIRLELEGLRQRILDGEDFGELAKQFSDGPSAPQGGDVGFFSYNEMVQPFSEAAFDLNIGQVSTPVRTIYGLHLIEVLEQKDSHVAALEELRDKIIAELQEERGEQRTQDLLNRLAQATSVRVQIPALQIIEKQFQ